MRAALKPIVFGTNTRTKTLFVLLVTAAAVLVAVQTASANGSSFVGGFTKIDTVASTVPANGDINPYGVAVVPSSKGRLVKGDVLVSNFNNSSNAQGTGTTIVEVSPGGSVSTFAKLDSSRVIRACPGGIGLTTALAVLKSGWVIVGSLPTSDGTSATAAAGCLIVINSAGNPVATIAGGPINGPWDMTALDHGNNAVLFVTNVLNGTVAASPNTVHDGTVVRIGLTDLENGHGPRLRSETTIGQGFPERTDPAALVVGPTGLGLSTNGTLYVADSVGNRIAAIDHATTRTTASNGGTTVTSDGSLNDPLGLTVAPGGDILTTNGGDGNLVETTPNGHQVAVTVLDNTPVPPGLNGNGTLFGLAITPDGSGVYFVDDGSNTLNLLH
jgi:hypothetical protein